MHFILVHAQGSGFSCCTRCLAIWQCAGTTEYWWRHIDDRRLTRQHRRPSITSTQETLAVFASQPTRSGPIWGSRFINTLTQRLTSHAVLYPAPTWVIISSLASPWMYMQSYSFLFCFLQLPVRQFHDAKNKLEKMDMKDNQHRRPTKT